MLHQAEEERQVLGADALLVEGQDEAAALGPQQEVGVLDALCDAWSDAPRLEAPVLLLQGDADRIVNAEAPLKWLPLLGSRDKSLWLIPGHLHELLNEPGWEATSHRILTWLDGRVPGSKAGPADAGETTTEPASLTFDTPGECATAAPVGAA